MFAELKCIPPRSCPQIMGRPPAERCLPRHLGGRESSTTGHFCWSVATRRWQRVRSPICQEFQESHVPSPGTRTEVPSPRSLRVLCRWTSSSSSSCSSISSCRRRVTSRVVLRMINSLRWTSKTIDRLPRTFSESVIVLHVRWFDVDDALSLSTSFMRRHSNGVHSIYIKHVRRRATDISVP